MTLGVFNDVPEPRDFAPSLFGNFSRFLRRAPECFGILSCKFSGEPCRFFPVAYGF